jgi:hypothetical protein
MSQKKTGTKQERKKRGKTKGNVSLSHPPNSNMPSSIVVGNSSILPITSVGGTVLPGPFFLNNILVAPDIIQNLLSIRKFTTDNSCSMKFDPFVLSVKDLAMWNVIVRSNTSGPVYTLRLPTWISTPQALTALAFASTWHHRFGHPGRDIISKLSSTTTIQCNKSHSDTVSSLSARSSHQAAFSFFIVAY